MSEEAQVGCLLSNANDNVTVKAMSEWYKQCWSRNTRTLTAH